jgi:hypothetical protein
VVPVVVDPPADLLLDDGEVDDPTAPVESVSAQTDGVGVGNK